MQLVKRKSRDRVEMKKQPLVSIIVPVYHVEKYLDDCVRSIMQQTYSKFELILVDDGSDDICPQKCEEWKARDARIKVIHKINGGLSDARNAGLEIAVGEYIAFVDSDDFVHEYYIEELLKIIEENDCDIAICGFQKFMDGRPIENKELKHMVRCLQPVECYRSTDAFYDVAWNKLYKRSVIGDIRYPYRKLHEDIYTTYKIIFSAERIGTTEEELYYYRQRGDSIIGNQTGAPGIDIEEALWERINFFKERDSAVYANALETYVSNVYKILNNTTKKVQSGDTKIILQRLKKIAKDVYKQKTLGMVDKLKIYIKICKCQRV